MPDNQDIQIISGANPDLVNKFQGQADLPQGSSAPDSIDTGIDTDNDGDLGTSNDVIGTDGSVLNDDGSAAGEKVTDDDQDVSDNSEAEDDPQADLEEQQAT